MKAQVVNCVMCGTGKRWWYKKFPFGYKCPTCDGNPLKGNGRADWQDYSRARMIAHFGPRMEGDVALLAKYRGEL